MESNELSKEDKQLISKIDELLVQLKTISQSVFELREHASLVLPDIAPIEQVEEVEYKVMLSECGLNTTKGRIYECHYEKGEDAYTIIDDLGNRNRGWDVACFSHMKSTREAYLSQQEQPKWKEGEWFKTGVGGLYLITKLRGHNFTADNQNGDVFNATSLEFIHRTTPEEIEQHLTKIAIEKYPVGTKIKDRNDKIYTISAQQFDYDVAENALFGRCEEFGGWLRLWGCNWASIVKEEVKESYEVFTGRNDNGFEVLVLGIESPEKANELKDKIKALLQTL